MKRLIAVFIGVMMMVAISCTKDNPPSENTSKTSFDIGNTHYESTQTTLYNTTFGQLIKVSGEGFEFYMVLSDATNSIFNITDTLSGTDSGKSRCILKLADDYQFSVSGSVSFDADKKTGTFQVNTEDLNLLNGQIAVDEVINQAIVDFTGLTETDYQGVSMNTGDPNDWIIRTNWEIIERLVFSLKAQNTASGIIQLIEYPNPFDQAFQMSLPIPEESKMDLFLVNTNFEIEQTFKALQPGNLAFLLDNPAYRGNFYRFYYRIYSGADQFYGSGDIKAMN